MTDPRNDVYLFLRDWKKWARMGADPRSDVFSRRDGLCLSIGPWLLSKSPFDLYSRHTKLEKELNELFKEHDLGQVWPFGEENYNARVEANTQHKDPARLNWVHKVLSQRGP